MTLQRLDQLAEAVDDRLIALGRLIELHPFASAWIACAGAWVMLCTEAPWWLVAPYVAFAVICTVMAMR